MTGHPQSDADAPAPASSTDTTNSTEPAPKTTDDTEPLRIEAPETSAGDTAIAIRIIGADPGATVEFTARFLDDDGTIWRSSAAFEPSEDGVVDLSTDAPTDGDWSGVEPMGWLWAMAADTDARGATLGTTPWIDVELSATAGDETATRTITRELYDPEISTADVAADGLRGTLFLPPGDDPAPGVIDLHGSGGRRSHRSARLLATHGFAVLALDYFGDDPTLPDELANVELGYVDTAADWLLDRPRVSSHRLGLFGVSRGAELAILLAARRDWVGPVVSYAGSGVPWDTPSDEPAWLDDGEPVSHITADEHPNATNLDEKPLRDRMPPVEQTNGPILLLSGGSDPVWNARRLSQIVVDRLDDHDVAHDYEHLTFDDVGHLIGIPYSPLSGFGDYEQMQATAHASEETWPVVLDYLDRGLQ